MRFVVVNHLRIAIIFIVVGFISGCSGSAPSDAEVSKAVIDALEAQFMEITEIERKNGYADGDNRYIVDVSYLVTFKQSLQALMEDGSKADRLAGGFLMFVVGDFKAGDSYEMERELTFVDTEKGWQVRD